MAIKKNQLLQQLDNLREEIRRREFEKTNQTTVVCSDDVLIQMAEKQPIKVEDFLGISGVNRNFMNNYASMFLQEILQYKNKSIREVSVSRGAYKTLDHYKDRLTNISKRNPNIYMSKLSRKKTLDLSLLDQSEDLVDFLTNKRRSSIKIGSKEAEKNVEVTDAITSLYRELNKSEKETGSYDLYIGYPFVETVISKEDFVIKAPLLFFPVRLSRQKREFTLKKDKNKDIQYNRDLLLSLTKIDKVAMDEKTAFIEEFNLHNLNTVVLPYYRKYGLHFKEMHLKFEFSSFQNEVKKDFIRRNKKQVHLKEYITLGRYRLYSSMIQKDMSQILETRKYNDLLEGLIDESGLYAQDETRFEFQNRKIKESSISYISDLNYSQELVMDLVNEEKKLVIWGPPGTGKSQTITNLVAHSVLKGENVLVISEKKVALDVIMSRLKGTSKYAMFIDDAEDKQSFYEKIKAFIDPLPPQRTINNDIFSSEENIDGLLDTLDESLRLMYKEKINGVPIYQLFRRYVKDKDIKPEWIPIDVHRMFQRHFKSIDFNILNQIEITFQNRKHFVEYLEYHKIICKYPIVSKLEKKITRSNRIIFENFTEQLNELLQDSKGPLRFRRKRNLRKFLQKNKETLLFLTVKKATNKKYMALLEKTQELHQYLYAHLSDLNRIAYKYSLLSADHLIFLDMITNDHLLKGNENISSYCSYLFDAFYTGYLEWFSARNQKYLFIFDKYREKMNELNSSMAEKLKVDSESFEMELYRHALDLSNSKRIMDMKRVLDSTHRMSIKAFIDVFQMELMNSIRIWMMTPEVVSAIIPLVYGLFDLVIFDEASQMYVEKGIPAIYRAKKVVIAGDTKQLRPSSLGVGHIEEEDDFYEEDAIRDITKDAKSLLDLARYRYKETILNYHYRSTQEELIAFSNHAFYDGKLIISPNQKIEETPPIEYIYVKNGIFENRRNTAEAERVVSLLEKILSNRKNHETVGVITFNSSQRDLIENMIDEKLFRRGKFQKLFEEELFRQENGEDKSLFVKNIENVQGDERDIIIFSMGYARDASGVVKRQFGWLNNDGGQNRLNVAVSRAKNKIYFVSSLHPEEFKVDDLKSVGPKLLKEYMRYCYYVSQNKPEFAKQILHQLSEPIPSESQSKLDILVAEVKQRIEKNNYNVKTDIGIGNYNINLAIYDEITNEYVLGILCDISDVSKIDARKDLLHQEKYLMSRGWKLYRLFSANWYKDANQELRNIRSIIR